MHPNLNNQYFHEEQMTKKDIYTHRLINLGTTIERYFPQEALFFNVPLRGNMTTKSFSTPSG